MSFVRYLRCWFASHAEYSIKLNKTTKYSRIWTWACGHWLPITKAYLGIYKMRPHTSYTYLLSEKYFIPVRVFQRCINNAATGWKALDRGGMRRNETRTTPPTKVDNNINVPCIPFVPAITPLCDLPIVPNGLKWLCVASAGSSSVVAEYNDVIIINDNDVINYERSIINHSGARVCCGALQPAPAPAPAPSPSSRN